MHSAFCFGNVAGVKPGGIGIEYFSKLFEKPFDKLLWFINRLWSAFNQFEWEKFTCNRHRRRRRRRKLNKKKRKQKKNFKCTLSDKMFGCVHVLQWLMKKEMNISFEIVLFRIKKLGMILLLTKKFIVLLFNLPNARPRDKSQNELHVSEYD